MQSAVTQARRSTYASQAQNVPVLRPHMLSREEGFVGALSLAAGLPTRAPMVVEELTKYQKSYRLDSTLSSLLRKAQATVNRGKVAFH